MAIVVPSLRMGGAERVACTLARHWRRVGHEVTIITYYPTATDSLRPPAGVRRIALEAAGQARHFLQGVGQATRRVGAVRRAFRQLRPDVVVSLLERTNVVSIIAALGAGMRVLACERSDPRRQHIEPHWMVLRRLLYPRAEALVVQTESVGDWARAFCSRVHVIPNFVERPSRTADPGAEEGQLKVIAVGRLSFEKGFDTLLRAFSRVCAAHPRWSLLILGDGPERRRLNALAADLRIEERVSMPGSTNSPEGEFAQAHAFALPSRFEGFPNALLEAMACGLPAVAFDCQSGPSEIIVDGDNGILVKDDDLDAFTAALDRIMGNARERARLGQRARDVAARFAPGPILERWSAVLQGEGHQR